METVVHCPRYFIVVNHSEAATPHLFSINVGKHIEVLRFGWREVQDGQCEPDATILSVTELTLGGCPSGRVEDRV